MRLKKYLLSVIALCCANSVAAQRIDLKLEPYRRSVAMRVEIAGKPRLFQFDTGAGISFISPEIAKELNCEKGGRVVGYRMTGDKLEAPRCDNVALSIGGKRFIIPVASVYDLSPLNAANAHVDGMIALDLFAGRTITMDAADGRLIVETPDSAAVRIAQAVELPASLTREMSGRALAINVDVPSPMGALPFELDSGNGGTLLIAKPYAAAFGFDPLKGPRIGTFAIGGGFRAEGFVIPADITLDGNLGMPFLKDYIVTMDLAAGRVWLSRNPVAAPAGMGAPPPRKE
ncbi:MAG: aspartyl protease family protein [Sphingomicrobium sp.]